MALHAKYAPSDAARWLACPGGVAASEGYPHEDNVYSFEGTVAHTLLATCIKEKKAPKDYLGVVLEAAPEGVDHDGKPDEAMVEIVDDCLKYIYDHWLSIPDMELFVEVRVDPKLNGCWGTTDLLFASKLEKYIGAWDFKYGQGVVVEVNDNPQTLTYLCGGVELVLDRWSQANGSQHYNWDYFKHMEHAILQPRGRHPEGRFRHQDVSLDRLRAFHITAARAITAAEKPDAPRIAGDKQCKWCPAKADCPAYAEITLGKAREFFTAQEVLAPDEVRYVLEHGDMIIDFVNTVRSKHIAHVMNGGDGLGFKVVAGQSRRIWKQGKEETEKALKSLKVKVADSHETKLLGPAPLEKVVKKQVKAGAYKDVEKTWEKFNALIIKPEGSPKLVREDAPGDPLTLKPEEMFDPVNDETDDAALAALL